MKSMNLMEESMRNMSDQQGNGFLDWIKQKIKNPRTLIPSLRDPSINPPLVRKWLEMHGREQITSIQVKRKPVQKAVQTFTNLLSFGQLNKAIKDLNYDDIFHLSLVINGKYEIDKKDVITEQNYNKENGEELIDVPLNGQYIAYNSTDQKWEKSKSYSTIIDFIKFSGRCNINISFK